MLSVITAATATGIGGRWAGSRCLQMLASQPGPMGGEVCELIRQRDPESPLLRWGLALHIPIPVITAGEPAVSLSIRETPSLACSGLGIPVTPYPSHCFRKSHQGELIC